MPFRRPVRGLLDNDARGYRRCAADTLTGGSSLMEQHSNAPINVGAWDRVLRVAVVALGFAMVPLLTRQPYWLLAAGLAGGLLLETAISAS